ncbi:hypothetical protein [Flavilitoribacter nigricans]|uniref:Uncharacterized protein n=1 Tax=Flavilitoribacter nigricans (strain ATCC 23147 / DSM 23189 / NBRC 102662 / NCIMB 1420 / SS-2) TaxID=1122177 RepID=A0A2D0NEX4_FLAN2|nr:hypothetical protein [Flavilitoribacter nigricans]PHN07061.1 hypothetical protein CRP01_07465 [Flavilitoribacter nigricans DSM 23189 = NBRC 102662]
MKHYHFLSLLLLFTSLFSACEKEATVDLPLESEWYVTAGLAGETESFPNTFDCETEDQDNIILYKTYRHPDAASPHSDVLFIPAASADGTLKLGIFVQDRELWKADFPLELHQGTGRGLFMTYTYHPEPGRVLEWISQGSSRFQIDEWTEDGWISGSFSGYFQPREGAEGWVRLSDGRFSVQVQSIDYTDE